MSIEGSISMLDLFHSCFGCTAGHANYITKLKSNRHALETAMEELKEMRNDVKRMVDIAEDRQLKRLDKVQGWLLRVEDTEAKVDKLIRDSSQAIEKKCFGGGGCCPKDCITSYKFGKKVVKKLKEVDDLKRKGEFRAVAEKLPLNLVDERPSEETVGLESTFEEVRSYLKDGRVGIIGLYGMGGVGKTTLLTKINNELCNSTPGFDFAIGIWIVVSKNLNLTKVQDDIGKKMGFYSDAWEKKSQEEKAVDIFGVLKKRKFVLMLDDLWERLDLLKMGIPLPDTKNKSKIVFTTRSEDVCGRMEAHKKIKVKILAPKSAWDLFQGKVGEDTLNFHPKIPELAETVAEECKGLPLALITIGRAMACKKTPQEWDHAREVLKKSAAEFSGMGDEVFPLLKFSYDHLPSDTVKSCFLYCSLFPEDFSIPVEKLIDYWVGEGFLDRFDDLCRARNQGHDIIGTLVHACLLEEDLSDRVKMHDVIRDMALWIACECGMVKDKFFVQAGDCLKKVPEVENWKGVEKMSLMHNQIEELAETPSCPNLLTLFLNNNGLQMIPRSFFQNMSNLKVLDLSENKNLRTAEISELVSLQYLNLSFTNIKELPIEFKNLVALKYLGLDSTSRLNVIPRGVLLSFKKLQVLKMDRCGSSDLAKDSVWCDGFGNLVKEVECLKDLNHFGITIKTATALSHILNSHKLQSSIKSLTLWLVRDTKYLDMSFAESMVSLDELKVQGCMNLEELMVKRELPDNRPMIIGCPCFHSLRSVFIDNCPMLKEVTWLIFAPNLENLSIIRCHKMEEIIRDGKWGEAANEGGYSNLFLKLKDLYLRNLPQLKSIYPNALLFPYLKSIKVYYCPNLKMLPLNSDSVAKGCQAVIEGPEDWFNELNWEDEATRNAFLTSFDARGVMKSDPSSSRTRSSVSSTSQIRSG